MMDYSMMNEYFDKSLIKVIIKLIDYLICTKLIYKLNDVLFYHAFDE